MSFTNRKVLVTGAAGLVGSNLIERLLSEGATIRAILHNSEPVVLNSQIEYTCGDLTNGEYCRQVVDGIDYVFHCAANTSGAATMATTPMVHVTPNILINCQLLEAAYDAHVEKFLWLSSTTGYPPTGDKPVTEEEMFDGDPYESYFFVGWMKRFTEVLCRMYGEKLPRTMTTIVLRPTNIYGPNDDFDLATSHVTAALIRKVIDRWDPVEIWGTGEDLRDLVYVDDMVEAMILAMTKVESFSTINIGMGQAYSVNQILQTALEVDGYANARVVYDDSKPSMIPVRLVDTAKAYSELGFRAKTDLREGLIKTIKWYREHHSVPRTAGAA